MQRAISFALAFAIPVYLANAGGGYDLVDHEVAATALWWTLALALIFGVFPVARAPQGWRPAAAAITALCVWTGLSLIWTESAQATFAEFARVLGYAGILAAVWLGVGPRTWRAVAAGLCAAALVIAAVAVTSRIAPELFDDPLTALSIDGRLAYPFGYWNATGAWAAIACVSGLAWSVGGRRPLARGLALALVPIAGTAVYLSYSRGAVAALAAALLVVALLIRERRRFAVNFAFAAVACAVAVVVIRLSPEIADGSGDEGGLVLAAVLAVAALAGGWLGARERLPGATVAPPRGRTLALAGVAVLGGIVIAAAAIGPRVAAADEETLTIADYPALGGDPASRLASDADPRPRIWAEAIDAAASSPLLGIGPGSFEGWWSREVGDPQLRDAHSLFFESLAELGIPGFLLVLALFGSLLVLALGSALRTERASDAAVLAGCAAGFVALIVSSGVDWIWEVPAVTVLGIALAAVAAVGGAPERRLRRLGWRRPAMVVIALIAGAIQIPNAVATELTRDSAVFLDRSDYERASEYAEDASTAAPWAASPYAQRAIVAEAQEDLDGAASFALEAIDREPENWRHRALLARIELGRDEPEAALARLREAVALRGGDPNGIGPASLIVLGEP